MWSPANEPVLRRGPCPHGACVLVARYSKRAGPWPLSRGHPHTVKEAGCPVPRGKGTEPYWSKSTEERFSEKKADQPRPRAGEKTQPDRPGPAPWDDRR